MLQLPKEFGTLGPLRIEATFDQDLYLFFCIYDSFNFQLFNSFNLVPCMIDILVLVWFG